MGIMDYSLLLAIEFNPSYHKYKKQEIINEFEATSDGRGSTDDRKLSGRRRSSKAKPDIVPRQSFIKTRHKYLSRDGKYYYHISVIDFLQDWNFDKKGESFLKTNILCRDYSRMSAVSPQTYCNRFIKFMRDKVIIDAKETKEDIAAAILKSKAGKYEIKEESKSFK